jgi:hypothetical protein
MALVDAGGDEPMDLFTLRPFQNTVGPVGVLLALLAAANPQRAAEPKPGPKLRLWVPAYYYPSEQGLRQWERLMKSAKQVPIVAVVNPDSGPGKKPDANYVALVGRARKAGLTMVGYIPTRYAKRPLAEVKAEVDTWLKFYPGIQGIHVDEQASAADKVAYYVALYRYIRTKISSAVVLGNPGTLCAEDYAARPAADVLGLFEKEKGFEDFRPPAWAKRYPPSRFGILAYQVGTADMMRAYVRTAVRLRIGYVYVTDAKGANPYDRLPSYWEAEVAEVQRLKQAKAKR